MISVNLSDIAILNVQGSGYGCIITLISKNEAINLLQNADLTEKRGTIWIFKNMNFFESVYKNGKNNYKIWLY